MSGRSPAITLLALMWLSWVMWGIANHKTAVTISTQAVLCYANPAKGAAAGLHVT